MVLATMCSNIFIVVLTTCCIIAVYCTKVSLAYPPPPTYSNDPTTVVNDNEYGDGYKIPQLNLHYSQLQQSPNKHSNQQEQQQQHNIKYPDQNGYLSYFTTSQTSSTSTSTLPGTSSASSTSTLSSSTKTSIPSAYVYKADIPTHIEPETNKVVNAVKLDSATTLSTTGIQPLSSSSYTTNAQANTNSNNDTEQDGDLSKKIIGSSVVTSVSVILNGNKPEFTDALGHKVPKPQPSLQVASPIDLLNPDRYEFYTFDENGELVKRLMTIEEIQSIVANGDGEGPTIIHNGPVEDRDPEKNVQDIVNSVQSVLNKEVESNKNTSSDNLPVFDTPDVSSSWSMILPAIFNNNGNVEIFPQQKPQQIVMTPDTELIETSTKESVASSTKKSKLKKRKPSTTTTTTEMVPQVIQEELDSEESVYTGMQQYQHLAATMQNFDGFSQLHMQPIYHKLPEIETSTRRVFINGQEIIKRPASDEKVVLNENLAKKPVSVHHKPTLTHRIKKPNGEISTTKRPQSNKQKIKNKSTKPPLITTSPAPTTTSPAPTTTPSTTTTTPQTTTTTTTTETMPTTTTTTPPPLTTSTETTTTSSTSQSTPTTTQIPASTAAPSSVKPPKKKKKKPTRHPIHSTDTNTGAGNLRPHLSGEKRKPSPIPHRPKPRPTQQQSNSHLHITTSTDLAAEGSAHQEVSQNKYHHVSYHRPRPKPSKYTTSTTSTTTSTTTTSTPSPEMSTTVIISPVPTISSTVSPQPESLIVQNFSGYQTEFNDYGSAILTARVTTEKPEVATSANTPAVSGTSGYPVPAYAITSDDPQHLTINQFKKRPLPSFSMSKPVSEPYEEDKQTQQAFDQILQTLKQPDQITQNHSIDALIKPDVKPVEYGSPEEILEQITNYPAENTANYGSSTFSTTLQDFAMEKEDEIFTTQLLPQLEQQDTTKTSDMFTNIPSQNNTTTEDAETTELPSFASFTDVINESSIIGSKVSEPANLTVQKVNNDDYIYDSASELQQQPTYAYGAEQTTGIIRRTEQDVSEQSKIETRLPVSSPNKVENMFDDEKEANYPVLVADLKPQLNMEVIKPSEQISMSDFQTQAATVASTLLDGTVTATTDYSSMNSNETKDEIELLMSDVIKQISNSDKISSSNDNRYSNQAHLDVSFLMHPNKQAAIQPSLTSIYGNQLEDNKPIFESTEYQDHQTEHLEDDFKNHFFTTEIPETTTLSESEIEELNSTEKAPSTISSDTVTEETQTSNEESTTIQSIQDSTFEATTKTNDGNESSPEYAVEEKVKDDDNTPTITYADDSTTHQYLNESKEEEMTTLKDNVLLLSEINAQKQKLEDESEDSFEIQSSVDTTTNDKDLFEDTTPSEKTQTNIQTEEISTISNNVITEETISQSTENEFLMETTTIKEDVSNDMEQTTEISNEASEEEKINSNETEFAAAIEESIEGLESNTYADTKPTEISLLDDSTSTESLELTISVGTEATSIDIDSNPAFQTPKDDITQKDEIEDSLEATTIKISPTKEVLNESTAEEFEENKENPETTTSAYQMSEETSAELNAMISEEDETDDSIYEDPYIKLGETTTQKPEIPFHNNTQSNDSHNGNKLTEANISEAKPNMEDGMPTLGLPKPIQSLIEYDVPTATEQTVLIEKIVQPFEEADEEDEEDQFGYQTPKLPISVTTSTTTTSKPKITTTRRLNTLKPVSYFNKQPAYTLYQDPASSEPLYHKQSAQSLEKDYPPYKVVTYNKPTPQQRPMHRPPQLSNLMISSTQATRPPIKLEPPPSNSKGLEASVANLDKDILAFTKLCNELAFAYWKSITSEKISSARSLVISPFALTSMLSMVFLGARGSTSGEMNDVLRLDDMVSFNPHLVFKNITDSVEKAADSDIATTAFVREIFSDRANGKILQFFKEKTQQLYAGHVEEVNFHVVNDIIRRRTNLLIKRHTMGKVLEYLRTNSVWVNGPLATISGNLFQTDCSHGSTQDRDGELFFQVHPTVRQRRLVPIPAVLFKSGFTAGYEPNLDATVVAFGRIQDTTSMIYVMPGHLDSLSPSDNLDRFEKKLLDAAISKNGWSNILTSLMDRPSMEVQLPRFSHRSFINATLGLQKMGFKGLFKSDYADLGGLTGSSNRDIYISDMIQINTFSTCGEEKIADHHHVEMYPAPPLRKRNKDVGAHDDDQLDSSEAIIDFGSLVQDSVLGRGFYDDLLDPKYLELPLPLRPRQARVPDAPRLKFDKPFLYFVRHNPTGMILFMGRFNPRLLP